MNIGAKTLEQAEEQARNLLALSQEPGSGLQLNSLDAAQDVIARLHGATDWKAYRSACGQLVMPTGGSGPKITGGVFIEPWTTMEAARHYINLRFEQCNIKFSEHDLGYAIKQIQWLLQKEKEFYGTDHIDIDANNHIVRITKFYESQYKLEGSDEFKIRDEWYHLKGGPFSVNLSRPEVESLLTEIRNASKEVSLLVAEIKPITLKFNAIDSILGSDIKAS